MARGIIHRKMQTNRARELGADDHLSAGIGALALSNTHRDNPDSIGRMLNPPKVERVETVTVPRDLFDELVSRVQALENASHAAPKSPESLQSLALAAASEQSVQ